MQILFMRLSTYRYEAQVNKDEPFLQLMHFLKKKSIEKNTSTKAQRCNKNCLVIDRHFT